MLQNELIFFHAVDSDDKTNLQIMAYSSMDVLEERERAPTSRASSLFHGCLLSNVNYQVASINGQMRFHSKLLLQFQSYGYMTNTQVKLLLIYDAADQMIRDQDVQTVRFFTKPMLNEVGQLFYFSI